MGEQKASMEDHNKYHHETSQEDFKGFLVANAVSKPVLIGFV